MAVITVNIALVEDGQPTLGVVWHRPWGGCLPASPPTARAQAFEIDDQGVGHPRPAGSRRGAHDAGQPMLARRRTGPRPMDRTPADRRAAGGAGDGLPGSSLKLCRIAPPAKMPPALRPHDGMGHRGRPCRAGCGRWPVLGLDGRPLAYGKPGHENASFVAWAVRDRAIGPRHGLPARLAVLSTSAAGSVQRLMSNIEETSMNPSSASDRLGPAGGAGRTLAPVRLPGHGAGAATTPVPPTTLEAVGEFRPDRAMPWATSIASSCPTAWRCCPSRRRLARPRRPTWRYHGTRAPARHAAAWRRVTPTLKFPGGGRHLLVRPGHSRCRRPPRRHLNMLLRRCSMPGCSHLSRPGHLQPPAPVRRPQRVDLFAGRRKGLARTARTRRAMRRWAGAWALVLAGAAPDRADAVLARSYEGSASAAWCAACTGTAMSRPAG